MRSPASDGATPAERKAASAMTFPGLNVIAFNAAIRPAGIPRCEARHASAGCRGQCSLAAIKTVRMRGIA